MPIGIHHGSLSKLARVEAENDYKNGELKSLICTSSLELGIDVGNTDFVIQYNSPREVTRVVQRVGRSGHKVGQTSKGLILATNPEDIAESFVIARKALHGELEQFMVRQNPLGVLSNQIISMVLEYGQISSDKIFDIITRSYPFHTLSQQLYYLVLKQLRNQRSIWFEETNSDLVLKKRMSSRTYFLDNISMIPDEKTYLVRDISSRTRIGKLDESFVLNYGFEGAKFILKGRPWTIIRREDEELLVQPIKEIGNVPSWVGEDIPIPYEVALEVGQLRKKAKENQTLNQYPADEYTLKKFYDFINKQQKEGFIVPTDNIITIDVEDKTVIINACFGTRVNETLGRLISAILAQQIGESIGINSDAYRVSFELPGRIPPDQIKQILLTTKPETLKYLMETILKNSTYIRWQLVHVGRKFGAIKKDFDVKNIGMKKLLNLFDQTPVFDEAIHKLIWERMDLNHTKQVLSDIQSGKISINIQGLSPIGTAGFETIRGLMVPQRADRSILMAMKKRLEDTEISFVCANCKNKWNTTVGRTSKQPSCSRCNAIKITVLRRYNKEQIKLFSKQQKTKEELRELRRLHKNASLVLSHGRYAVLALMGRGIGPDTAARILRRYNPSDLEKSDELLIKFLRDLLQAELTYAKTRGFWDN